MTSAELTPTSSRTNPAKHQGCQRRASSRCVLALWVGSLIGLTALDVQAEDVSVREPAWNGLSELVEIARTAGVKLATPTQLDVSQLTANDALLLVHPESQVPVADLAAFLRKGGRLAVADDFGRADTLLEAFSIGRSTPSGVKETRYLRGNPALLVATKINDHPLARGVGALVTNHPAVLLHPDLAPVFALDERGNAVVLSGAVGAGRLVAISDSSVLINNMLELQGNRVFAQHLVRYLTAERSGTLYIAGTDVVLSGSGLRSGEPLADIDAALARVAELKLPRTAVIVITLVLACVLLFAAVSALPRRKAYVRRFEAPECLAGYAGRLRHHDVRRDNFVSPMLAFKFELESVLLARMRMRGSPLLKDTLQAMREGGVSERTVDDTRALLAELDALQLRAHGEPPRVAERKFVEIIARGRRILADLDRASMDTRVSS